MDVFHSLVVLFSDEAQSEKDRAWIFLTLKCYLIYSGNHYPRQGHRIL